MIENQEKRQQYNSLMNQKINQIPRELIELLNDVNIELSQKLLNENETAFKIFLLQKISKQYSQVQKVWSKLIQEKVVHFESLTIDKSSWVSSVQQGNISLGGLSIPLNVKDRMIFFDQRFTYEDEVIWKLSHELSHIVAHNLVAGNIGISKLFNDILLASRKSNQGNGLTLMGSLQFYKNRGGALEQATEDITELINMYLLDPNYLKNSLELMRDMPDAWLKKYGLLRLDNQGIAYIFNTIKEGVESRI